MGGILFSIIPVIFAVTSAFLIIAISKIRTFPYYLIEFGRRSYSVYIFHFIIIATVSILIKSAKINVGYFPVLVVVVVTTYWLAGFTYRKIELPFIGFSKRLAKRFT